MFFLGRAASFAAIPFAVALIASLTSPGVASELARPSITTTTLNALTMPQVPVVAAAAAQDMPAAAPQSLIQPAVVQQVEPQDAVVADDDQPDASYPTLAAAVAAQDAETADRELHCLAAGVYFESKGEPLAGQLAVAQTILNRTTSGRFPKSICSVLTQRGQFSFVRGGVVPSAIGRAGWKVAVAVAKVAQRDLWDDAAPNALFFHARHVSPGWRMARVASIGNHVFYR